MPIHSWAVKSHCPQRYSSAEAAAAVEVAQPHRQATKLIFSTHVRADPEHDHQAARRREVEEVTQVGTARPAVRRGEQRVGKWAGTVIDRCVGRTDQRCSPR